MTNDELEGMVLKFLKDEGTPISQGVVTDAMKDWIGRKTGEAVRRLIDTGKVSVTLDWKLKLCD